MNITRDRIQTALLSLFMLVLCIYGIWSAGKGLRLGLALRQSDSMLVANAWTELDPPPAEMWQSMQSGLEGPLTYQADSSPVLRQLGLLYEMQPREEGAGNWPEALRIYRQAALLSPAWPDDWTRLAWAKYRNQQLDNEFLQALQNSLNLGAAESRLAVQHIILSPIAVAILPDQNSLLYSLADNYILEGLQRGGNYELKLNMLASTNLLATYCERLGVMGTPPSVLNRCNNL